MIFRERRQVSAALFNLCFSRMVARSSLLMSVLLIAAWAPPVRAQVLFSDSAGVRQLKEAVRLQSPEIVARRAAVDVARARLRAIGFAPAASLAAEMEEVPDGLNAASAGSIRFDLSREFFSSTLRSAKRAVSERDVERAQAELELAERSVDTRVDRALTLAIGGVAIARRLSAEDSLLASAEDGVRTRFAVGGARYVDVLRVRTERLRVQTDAATAFTEARIGRRFLELLIASSTGAEALTLVIDTVVTRELRDPLRIPLPAAPGLDSLIALSGVARFGKIAVARAKASQRLANAEQRPVFAGSIGVQRFAGESGGFTTGPTIGASVSLPFTARRANQATRAVAEREIGAAEAERDAAIALLRNDLTAAYLRYEASRERLTLFDAALLQGAREERESALAAYRSGELSLIELLDFERALARAEIARLRSRMEAAGALADLIAGAAGQSAGFHTEFTLPLEGDR